MSGSARPFAPPAKCTISARDTVGQLERRDRLKPYVTRIERSPGALVVSLDRAVEERVVHRFAEVERGCCSDVVGDGEGWTLRLSSSAAEDEPVLAEIARLIDAGQLAKPAGG